MPNINDKSFVFIFRDSARDPLIDGTFSSTSKSVVGGK